ncbi:MAG: hypothetical protein LBB98_12115 [Treponema sp.]|jgi:hypothetical protein|nr:hypothetical protein [Treponema sp.]
MIRTKRNIALTPEKRHELEVFTKTGKRSVKLVKRAVIILALDTSGARKPDAETDIAHRIGVGRQIFRLMFPAGIKCRAWPLVNRWPC